MTNRSTILVAGSAGFIGRHRRPERLAYGYEVVDNYDNRSRRTLKWVPKLAGRGLTAYEVHIRDRDAPRDVFDADPHDVVLHFAAKRVVRESTQGPMCEQTMAGIALRWRQAGWTVRALGGPSNRTTTSVLTT